ncbi:phosphatase PAP2 family protein [Streptomyces sp. MUM 203J]|uniref:phosphatase PAP2 family protein n=1 Tax=Streptomyces sp. MUM 203J TaxID=2791990 RepID=UPI001F03B4B1|nr:phosphatase PAP2 family protein [Streptomyces sp. MUM 203J]MCH0540747.1 phosphatase PAP2 family protein [Streptomyces sp. MUM 203J]
MSEDLYRAITDFAHGTPPWVHTFTEIGTDAGLFLFVALGVVVWWRARPAGARTMALAALVPVATAFGYVVSEVLKTFVQEERPCRAVVGAAASIAECPVYGDWSFPSNHSAIAGAFAMALALAWRRIAWLTMPLAVVMAFSRVFVGVHYPHDVAAGLVVGALSVALFVRLLTGPTAKLVEAMRTSGSGAANWLAGAGEAERAATGRRPERDERQATAPQAPRAGYAPAAPEPEYSHHQDWQAAAPAEPRYGQHEQYGRHGYGQHQQYGHYGQPDQYGHYGQPDQYGHYGQPAVRAPQADPAPYTVQDPYDAPHSPHDDPYAGQGGGTQQWQEPGRSPQDDWGHHGEPYRHGG